MFKFRYRSFMVAIAVIFGIGIVSLYRYMTNSQGTSPVDCKAVIAKTAGKDSTYSTSESKKTLRSPQMKSQNNQPSVPRNDNLAPVYNADSEFPEGKEPYFWKDFASMRQPAVRDPKSKENRKIVATMVDSRRRRLGQIKPAKQNE